MERCKKKILMLGRNQFGYLIDTLKWCEYLKEYEITVVGFDLGLPKIGLPNVKPLYVKHYGPAPLRGFVLLAVCFFCVLFFKGEIIWVNNFPKAYLLKKILFWRKMHLDLRTLSIQPQESLRMKEDEDTQKACQLFDSISFISEGLRDKMPIPKGVPSYILHLGADIISYSDKSFDELKLVYIGTLYNRKIIDTIEGLGIFTRRNPGIKIHYDIVGDSYTHEEIKEMIAYVKDNNLSEYVTMHGQKPYNELGTFLENNNIGVCYVPMTTYYDCQPPTKTYEYALSGLVCIATNTSSNREIINEKNGILINDNPESFAQALEQLKTKNNSYNSCDIRATMLNYTWEKIVNIYLRQIINNIAT